MSRNWDESLAAARRRYEALSTEEQVSESALHALTYVASELLMGVVEDRGDFECKKAYTLRLLCDVHTCMSTRDACRCCGVHSSLHNDVVERAALLTPKDRVRALEMLRSTIADIQSLEPSDERAARIVGIDT
jgi:hypothetical protein